MQVVQHFALSNEERYVIVLAMRHAANTEFDLFEQAARAVQGVTGLECRITRQSSPEKVGDFDGVARLRFRKSQFRQPYVARRSLNPTTIHLLTLLRRDSPDGLLVATTHVNDRQACALREAGVHFIDTSGNVHVETRDLYLWVSGRQAASRAVAIGTMRAFHASGTQLLFSLLTDPLLNSGTRGSALIDRPYRDISAATGVSRSTVGWVMADLVRQGFVVKREDGARRLVERKRMLERWVQAYLDRLRPNLVIERYRPARGDWWKTTRLEGGLWSGEVAAALLTGELKPGTATVFGAPPSHTFVLHHDLQKDPQGTVEFLRPFWRNFDVPASANNCVHPLLVYADLMSIDDERTHEVAKSVYNRHLRSIVETT